MKRMHAFVLAAAVAGPPLAAGDYTFAEPRQLNGGDKAIEVEAPGYAAPGLADLTGDGVPDLLVGQFRDGKIGFYKGSKGEDGKLSFGAHEWLQAGGEIAKIPRRLVMHQQHSTGCGSERRRLQRHLLGMLQPERPRQHGGLLLGSLRRQGRQVRQAG